jgi:hypothetical protein
MRQQPRATHRLLDSTKAATPDNLADDDTFSFSSSEDMPPESSSHRKNGCVPPFPSFPGVRRSPASPVVPPLLFLVLYLLVAIIVGASPLVTANATAAEPSETVVLQQRIVDHPRNTSARFGETVTLQCRVENQVISFFIKYFFCLFCRRARSSG